MRNKGTSECDSTRKRGRPAGKNRVPLTLEERRARNTQYERERRNEKSKAMAELAAAAGCQSSISAPDLLATVISQIQNAANKKSSDDIDNLRRINENLMSQISKLESQLMLHCPDFESNCDDDIDGNNVSESERQPAKTCNSTKTDNRPRNRKPVTKRKRKTQSEESDSPDSVDLSTDGDEEIYIPKRRRTQLETKNEIPTRRETRNYSTSQSSYDAQSPEPDHAEHRINTDYKTEINSQSDLINQTLQPEYTENILTTPPLVDTDMPAEPRLSSILDCPNWSHNYFATNPINQPEYTSTAPAFNTITSTTQEAAISNDISDDIGLLPNIELTVDDVDFINDFEWFNGILPDTSLLDDGNNFVYS